MFDVSKELIGRSVTVETDDAVVITGILAGESGDFLVLRDESENPMLFNTRYIRRLWLTVESPESA